MIGISWGGFRMLGGYIFAGCVLAGMAWAEPQVFTWRGGAADDGAAWTLAANWEADLAPVGGDKRDVIIPGGLSAYPRMETETTLAGSLRIEEGARITVSGARLVVERGLFVALGAEVELLDGGEIWSDVARAYTIINWPTDRMWRDRAWREDGRDVGVKLTQSFKASERLPHFSREGGNLPDIWRVDVGTKPPEDLARVNIAPYAERRAHPYTMMTHLWVDPDPQYGTFIQPQAGIPAASRQYDFRFPEPQPVAGVAFNSPASRWVLEADTTGDGAFDRVLAMDLAGVAQQPPDGSWVARTTVTVHLWPAVPLWAVRLNDLPNPKAKGGSAIYDFQILAPADGVTLKGPHPHAVMRGEHLNGRLPVATLGDPVDVPEAAADRQLPRGFHIEPWMFNLDEWIDKPAAERPPLGEYEPFAHFVGMLRGLHANTVNLWPPKKFNDRRGDGVYEFPLLWPSEYDRHSLEENVLEQVATAFREAGIRLMTMTRTSFPKPEEEFPEELSEVPHLPFMKSHPTRYLAGIVREQAASGVAGVGIGFDEQEWRWLDSPAAFRWGPVGEQFTAEYGLTPPNDLEDTVAFRKWNAFGYLQFARYLAHAAAEAKRVNPGVITKSPISITVNTFYNDRARVGIAEDIVARTADIDYYRAYAYLNFELGHYVSAIATKVTTGGRSDRRTVSLHNCPWAHEPEKQPGFYLHFPPVYMLGSPLSAVMHGGGMPLFWRYNWIFFGGYDAPVRQAFGMLDTLSAWGLTEARPPRTIAVLRSRASEDWWQVRQRFNPAGDLMDQARGHLNFKVIVEALLAQGYPFDVFYLDHPEELEAALADYPVVLLPFAYSVSTRAVEALEALASDGKRIIVFDRKGETDEWGEPHPEPLFAEMLEARRAMFVGADLTAVGQHPGFQGRFARLLDRQLGDRKPTYFNAYGNDVEMALLEKGPKEKFLALINWTERPVTVDVGVNVPPGAYRVQQTGRDGAHALVIGGTATPDAATLAKFRLTLDPGDARVLHIAPAD